MFPENREYNFFSGDQGLFTETKHGQYHKEQCTDHHATKLEASNKRRKFKTVHHI